MLGKLECDFMNGGYVLLTEKEEMWAHMLAQVLDDNHVPYVTMPVHGAGFSLKTGMQDCLRIYVPAEALPQATDLLQELFSAEPLFEDEL